MAEPSIAREGQATPARRVHIVKLPGGWHDHKNYSRAQSSSHVVESTAFCQACRPRAALTEDSPRLYKKAKPPLSIGTQRAASGRLFHDKGSHRWVAQLR
jgi:hypothetical protein